MNRLRATGPADSRDRGHLSEPDIDAAHNAYRHGRRAYRTFLREVVAQHTGAGSESLDAACRRVTKLLSGWV